MYSTIYHTNLIFEFLKKTTFKLTLQLYLALLVWSTTDLSKWEGTWAFKVTIAQSHNLFFFFFLFFSFSTIVVSIFTSATRLSEFPFVEN